MNKHSEKLVILALVGGFFLFLTLCSCENENLIDPPDFFDPDNPETWDICDHPCGVLTSSSRPNAAPRPGDSGVLICTGPNPTSGPICIEYVLPSEMDVALSIYSRKGEKVRTLVRERQSAVPHSREWDLKDDNGRAVPNGTYRAFFKAGDYVTHGDIVVAK